MFQSLFYFSCRPRIPELLAQAKHEVLKMMPIGGCGLGQLMMNDVLDNFLYKWRNYLKSKGLTECSSTDGSEKNDSSKQLPADAVGSEKT